ncbi:hypothetical protein ACX3SL_11215 [Morganella morganii]
MGGIITPLYWILNIVQIAAVIAGFHDWLEWNIVVSVILAVVVGWMPLVGTFLGVMGAVYGWGWEYWQAILLFAWPIIFILFFGAAGSISRSFYDRR